MDMLCVSFQVTIKDQVPKVTLATQDPEVYLEYR